MSTIYQFPVNHVDVEVNLASALGRHVENILLLGDFLGDSNRITPTAIRFSVDDISINHKLFANARDHFWNYDTHETTKFELRNLRMKGNADKYYDIDVLRMSEPRVLFIADTLELINSLPRNLRLKILEHEENSTNEGTLNRKAENDDHRILDCAFQHHFNCIIGHFHFVARDISVVPSEFKFERYPEQKSQILSLTKGEDDDIFKNFLKHFREIISLEVDASRIVSFQLRKYEHWLDNSAAEPFEILGVLSRDCNAKCDFCYVHGNPRNTAIKLVRFSSKKSALEAEIRLKYFSDGMKLPLPTYDTEEIITHPSFFDVCEKIRQFSGKCISITTNGYLLSEENILRLKKLHPIDISLSLNATDPKIRQWLMGGNFSQGLLALKRLDKYEIPCAVTIVAWPRVPLDEVIKTIFYADQFNVRSISLLLGGFTKMFPNPPEYPIPSYWNQVINKIAPLREKLTSPFIIQPRLYEEQFRFGSDLGRNIITGVGRYSPAALSGLKVYDEILQVDGVQMMTRNQCIGVLSLLRQRQLNVGLTVRRKDEILNITVDCQVKHDKYLYGPPFSDRFGLHLIGENIRLGSIREIYNYVEHYKANRVLFLTSMIVRPFLANLLQQFSILSNGRPVEFDLQVPSNEFLGGNIVMGDMLVLDDFYGFIEQYLANNTQTDLILLPSGPFNHGGWLRDMKGQPFRLLQRGFDIPIELIKAPYFE